MYWELVSNGGGELTCQTQQNFTSPLILFLNCFFELNLLWTLYLHERGYR